MHITAYEMSSSSLINIKVGWNRDFGLNFRLQRNQKKKETNTAFGTFAESLTQFIQQVNGVLKVKISKALQANEITESHFDPNLNKSVVMSFVNSCSSVKAVMKLGTIDSGQ